MLKTVLKAGEKSLVILGSLKLSQVITLSLHFFLMLPVCPPFKYYLIHEKERFIIFKTRGAAERFRYDKTRLFECIKGLQIRRIVMLNRMQHYIKNTNERDRLYKVPS